MLHDPPDPPRFPTNLRKKISNNNLKNDNINNHHHNNNHGYHSYTMDRRPKQQANTTMPWHTNNLSNENLNHQNNILCITTKNNNCDSNKNNKGDNDSLPRFYKNQKQKKITRKKKQNGHNDDDENNNNNDEDDDDDDNDLHLKLFIPQKTQRENATFDLRSPNSNTELRSSIDVVNASFQDNKTNNGRLGMKK